VSTLLLKNIDTLATFDADRRRLRDAWVLIREGLIDAVGTRGGEPAGADQQLDLAGHIVLPGLINLHHHFFQSQLRNIPDLQDASLFDWLRILFRLSSELTDEDLYVASLVSHAQLLLSGCTTTVDHHYIKVNDVRFDTCIEAAREAGIRFHLARGSLSLGQKDGATPPDDLVETEDDILADCERLLQAYHDSRPGAMVRVDLAPSSIYTSRPSLMQRSVELARKYSAGSHMHLAVNDQEANFTQGKYGKRSIQLAEDVGYAGPDVWYAHAVRLDDDDIRALARTGTAVTHCPNANMLQAYGCCPVKPLLQAGVTVSLGVDGSASNNASNVLDEVRNALLLQRVFYGHDALSATQALELAVLGGAKTLRRDELGVIAPGKAADLIAVDLRRVEFAGGLHDPVAALVLTESGRVDWSIVNGRIRVAHGQLVGIDLPALIRRQNERSLALVRRTERRHGASLSQTRWRRAFPYDPSA
jgi:cytosine/adenosine deaminase-related metal-dependent hydrolase